MAEANGTPIRLVKDNKELIELEATSIALTVERDVDVTPLPTQGGRRYAIDLNKNRSIIVIEGVFTDDRKTSDATVATALIDFSSYYTKNGDRRRWAQPTGAAASTYISGLLEHSSNRLRLKSTDGTVYSLAFTTGASVGYDSGTANTIVVRTTGGTSITDAQFATAVTSWINTDATAKFTASTITSEHSNRTGTAVLITQKTAGRLGNQTAYPKWDVDSGRYSWNDSYIEPFSGGVDGTKKSAGDKVADIYGIMNNSAKQFGDNDTIKEFLTAGIGALAAIFLSGGLKLVSQVTGEADGDYISGIQIPYNSTITAGGDTYVARNFFMPTGWSKSAFRKSSAANTLPAGVTFDTGDEYTGIQGIMKKIDITHDAGESVYGFNMVFLPADWVA